ncbi:unnamed protein product [Trifolium pratense]|uniref:Uncharacterized protein n=1 Tax=Trifolium pratense TaxID=57577 RepID=A0ACB0LRY4_TRIPR|nr:unnamed protein product [Trifolium pratense]
MFYLCVSSFSETCVLEKFLTRICFLSLMTKEVSDPLCMMIYTCCDGNPEWFGDLYSDGGWPVVVEIVRTASSASFGEDWIKLLLSRICLEESQLPVLFSSELV